MRGVVAGGVSSMSLAWGFYVEVSTGFGGFTGLPATIEYLVIESSYGPKNFALNYLT